MDEISPENEHENAEKSTSLHEPKFVDVLKALLDAKPMPKENGENAEETRRGKL